MKIALPCRSRVISACLVSIACAVALSTWGATTAAAKQFQFRSCYPGDNIYLASNSGWGYYWAGQSPAVAASIDCPTGVSLAPTQSTILDYERQVHFGSSNYMPIGMVKFRVSVTGDLAGYEFTVHGCDDCGPIKTLVPPQPGVTEWDEAIDMYGQKRIVVRATCKQLQCTSRGKLSMNSFELAMRDDNPPTLHSFTMTSDWTRIEMVEMSIDVYDWGESGLASTFAGFVGESYFWAPVGCTLHPENGTNEIYAYPLYCPNKHSSNGYVDLRGKPDGQHTMEVRATDAAGNVMPTFRKTFKIDRTAPGTPFAVTVDGIDASGWLGQRLARVSWKNREESASTTTQSGLMWAHYDLKPLDGQTPDPAPVRQGANAMATTTIASMDIPADGRWELATWTEDRAGNVGGKQSTLVGRDLDAPPPPALGDPGWLNRTALISGAKVPITFPSAPELESGVCGVASSHNGQSDSVPTTADVERDFDRIGELPANLPEGRSWYHARSVSCAGMASTTAHVQLQVDSKPPAATLVGASEEWIADGSTPRIVSTDVGSGIAMVRYRVGDSTEQSSTNATVPLDLGSGEHRVRFTAVDVAGNESEPGDVIVRVDETAPVAGFDGRTNDDPTLLSGRAADAHSGVQRVAVALHNRDQPGAPPIPLQVQKEPNLSNPGELRFRARIDDAELAPGDYRAVISATDKLGNAKLTSQVLATGGALEFRSPIRARRTVSADLALVATKCVAKVKRGCAGATKCSAKSRKCSNERVVLTGGARPARTEDFGRSVAVVGRVATETGAGVAGVAVSIRSQLSGVTDELIGTAVTDATGRYTFELPSGPNRRLIASVAETPVTLGATDHADLGVRASGTLRVSLRRNPGVLNAEFRGRLKGLVGSHSPENVFIVLEFKSGNGWQTGIRTAVVDSRGRFVASPAYPFVASPTGRKSIRVRARIRAEGTNWPYRDGRTNALEIKLPR